jgi:translation initiation factor 3 subunit C
MSFWEDDDKSVEEEKGNVNKSNPFANQRDKKYKYDDSESSEDNKRVLKTPKEKLTETIKNCSDKIKDNIYQKNFVAADEVLNDLVKQVEKIKQIFGDNPPMILIKSLFLIEEATNMSKEERIKLSSKNSTALIGMKKNFIKLVKTFEEKLKEYKDKRAADGESEDEL